MESDLRPFMWIERAHLGAFTASQQAIQQMIIAASIAKGVDPALALAVAAHESQFNPNAKNCANANGTCDAGVMQVNETNWASYGISDNPYDPQGNIEAGTSMLATLTRKYDGNESQILCAYQYGPGRCGDASNLPPLTPGFVTWVNNWIQTNSDVTAGLPTAAGDGATADAGPFSGSVSVFGFDIPFAAVALGLGILAALFWTFTR